MHLKKIDFCIMLDPESSSDADDHVTAERNNARCRFVPDYAMNHTDLQALDSRPIAVQHPNEV
jgi:hypothetical protein